MDELSPLFQEIEFSERWRGYDPDEVDAFVDRVARAAAHVQGELSVLRERAELGDTRGPASMGAPASEEALTRTLVLAQKTADAAVTEAREEADRLVMEAGTTAQATLSGADAEAQACLREARAEADALLAEAEARAAELVADADAERRQLIADAEAVAAAAAVAERDRLAAEVAELQQYRAYLADDIDILERHLVDERERVRGSVTTLMELIDAPGTFRPSPVPATSGVEIDEARLAPSTGEPEPIEDPDLEAVGMPTSPAADHEPVGHDALGHEALSHDALGHEALSHDALGHDALDRDVLDEAERTEPAAPDLGHHDEPARVLDGVVERIHVDTTRSVETDAVEPVDEPADLDRPLDRDEPAEEIIDLVEAEAMAATPTVDPDTTPGPDGSTPVDDAGPPPPDDGLGVPPDRPQGGTTEVLSPPRLVTAADLGDAPVDEVVDPGPATAPMPTIHEESLFAPQDSNDDPFLAQLRDAVAGDDVVEGDEEALSAFFDQDDDDSGRSWFGRRR